MPTETGTAARNRCNHQARSLTRAIEYAPPYGIMGGMETPTKRRKCSVPDCDRLGRNKGMVNGAIRYDHKCEIHHRNKAQLETIARFFRKHIANVSCEQCGWSAGDCDRHRIIPSLGYARDNVKILCPNCHRLQHQLNKPRPSFLGAGEPVSEDTGGAQPFK